ncbi:MAG TPA: lysylphosphatidylglycerol synthase transmembrane domain-containing protein [Candidatus Baltobacteraceae bacterium]|nr:lysylphosphatidylglycerol synthase transmembrane domain-containing protein [Candidatus Baltobacteraceae bacterium]
MSQGKMAAQAAGLNWTALGRWQQWHWAWTNGPRDLWNMLRLTQLWALIVSAALVGLALFVGVLRWRIVLEAQGLDLPLGRATRISFVAQFFNSFLLGSTGGDLIKAFYAARETHHKKTEAVTTVFVDRLVGLWAMLFFAGVMMLPNIRVLGTSRDLYVPALFILAMLGALTVVLGLAFWGGVSKRFPRARHLLRRLPKGEVLERALDSCRQFGKQKTFLLKTIAISLFLNVLWVLQVMVLGSGLGLNISTLALFFIVPVIFCISALPITPNGLGVRENLFVLMLAVLGVPRTASLSVSLLASAEGLFWSLVGGMIYVGLRDKERLEEVTHQPAPVNEV